MANCDHAVVFVSDPAFLLPTLTAANQVKQQAAPDHLADIFIVLVGFDDAGASDAVAAVEGEGFAARRLDAIALPPDVTFNATHVPISSLARFFITQVIPEQYANIVYLDGDIQIVGDITPLLRLVVQKGYVAAANDKPWLGELDVERASAATWQALDSGPRSISTPGSSPSGAKRGSTWRPLAFSSSAPTRMPAASMIKAP